MILNRRVTRTILETTETTSDTQSLTGSQLPFVFTAAQFFYVGFHSPFASRYFSMGTANTNSVNLTVEYWDGTAWQDVDDFLDQTEGFTKGGFMSWINKSDWKASSQTGIDADVELYFIRITTDVDLSAGTTLEAVINLFSDDTLLRIYYPELITDTRYLPASRTDFLEQHQAAKNMVVVELKKRRALVDESQVIDINLVAVGAVHAVAYIILNPIAYNDQTRQTANDAFMEFKREIQETNLGLDSSGDGIVTKAERNVSSEPRIIRR